MMSRTRCGISLQHRRCFSANDYRSRHLLLFIDSKVIDLLPVGVETRGREGEGFAVRRKYADRCLDHFPAFVRVISAVVSLIDL